MSHWASVQHDHSILHLDLKPENVLLTWDTNALMYDLVLRYH
jgi:serine/threonine protein kinase